MRRCSSCGDDGSVFDVHCRSCGRRLEFESDSEHIALLERIERAHAASTNRVLEEADRAYAREHRKAIGRAVGAGLCAAVSEFFRAVFRP